MEPTGNRRGQETRAALLGAAAELVVEVGWGAVSTRSVAERAGVRPGLVHYHFGSVRQLLTEASAAALEEMVEGLTGELDASHDLEQGLRRLVDSIVDLEPTHPLHLLVTETYLAASRDPQVAGALRGVVRRMRERLAGWLASRGVPAGRSAEVAAFVAATLDGFALHRVLDADVPAPPLARLVGSWTETEEEGS
ncbi:TetR/AcrR family transcriptional regulator [Desertihabitans brevis]|uniref:TetR/AcrR family transcriptional regulator n=1 Tax=Desertihabitans brevis TaxID=2268447 RepID=A0A367YRA1_9ACTN|nr:TetR/AcrR family transcriptional regulator [Desertihabitans brevis]RCK68425.1 TetR/AcrR family transcriptional regulator [Desertihabitans brevis]